MLIRWPFGIALTSWAYMWRTTPMHRREVAGDPVADRPPPLPPGNDDVQKLENGAGPLFRRRYRVEVREAKISAEELIAKIAADPNEVAPGTFTHFRKDRGEEGRLAVGDEFTVRMPGPWNGPIRVIDLTPTSFRFATLPGHLEAGQIEWRAYGDLTFEIESWSRPGDRLSYLLHDKLRMAKEVQLHMWTSVCESVAKCGRRDGAIDIDTRRIEADAGGFVLT